MSQLKTDSQVLETSYGGLEVWDEGPASAKPPLVFLQGLLAPPGVWGASSEILCEEYRCIRVDWPFGAHRSPMAEGADLGPPSIARLVLEVLDLLLDDQRAILVGNDSGGVIAQLVVAAAPERLAGLVLIACDAFECFPPDPYRPLFRVARVPGVMRLLAATMRVRPFGRSVLGYGAVIKHEPERALNWLSSLAANPGVRRDTAKLMSGSNNSQTLGASQSFSQFERPVLVIWAKEDRLFSQALGVRLTQAFPRGRLSAVEDSRTFIPCDQPRRMAELIDSYVREDLAR